MKIKNICGKTTNKKVYFPIKTYNFGTPITEIDNNTANILLQALIKDSDIDINFRPINNIDLEEDIPNGNFELWDNCIPLSWEGDWTCTLNDEYLYKLSSPDFHKYNMNSKFVARSIGGVHVGSNADTVKTSKINTLPFPITGGSEYIINISFISKNGLVNYTKLSAPNDTNEIVLNDDLTIKIPKSNIITAPNPFTNSDLSTPPIGGADPLPRPNPPIVDPVIPPTPQNIILEPFFGAYIEWYNNSTKVGSSVISNLKGETSSGIPGSRPIEKENKTSVRAPITANYAKLYIWNGSTGIPEKYLSLKNPFVICSGVSISNIYENFNINIEKEVYIDGVDIEENMDSISYMNVNSPKIDGIEQFIEWDSSSLKGGYYDVTSKTGEISLFGVKDLKFGKENETTVWESWIPFTPNFTGITQEAKIHSVKLIVTASSSTPNIPGKMCAISAGLENIVENVIQPTTREMIESKTVITPVNNIITQSWVAGEEYEIDITNSAKALFGNDVLSWMTYPEWYTVAVILRDNSSGEGTHRTIAGIGNSEYSEPRLKITYSYPEYLEKNYTSPIKHDNTYSLDNSSFYTQKFLNIGGRVSNNPDEKSTCERVLTKFDTKEIPSNEIVTGVSLKLYQYAVHLLPLTKNINISAPLNSWGWRSSTWNKYDGVNYCIPHGHWENNTTNTIYATKNVTIGPSTPNEISFNFNPSGIEYVQKIISGQIENKGLLIRTADDVEGTSTSSIKVHSSMASIIENRPKLVVSTQSGNVYSIQNTIDYSHIPFPPDTPEPPPTPKKIELINSQMSSTGAGGNVINYELKGDINTNRYLVVSESWRYTPEENMANIFKIYFNGIELNMLAGWEDIRKYNYPNVRIWGIPIPNDYTPNVNYNIVIEKQKGGNNTNTGDITVSIRELANINLINPIKSAIHSYHNSGSSKLNSIEISVVPNGYLLDAFSLSAFENNYPNPSPTSNQTVDYSSVSSGFSHYSIIPDIETTVVSSWSLKYGSRSSLVAVSFNPN